MGKITKITASVIAAALILFSAHGAPSQQQLKGGENLRHEQVLLPPSVPERAQLGVIDNVMYLDEEGAAGILIYYDDPRTRWETDYIEFYDVAGELLVVTWIDRLGVCHVAMDRGLLDEHNPTVDGTLVIINVGRFL
jgi:hypothetical protein